LVGSFGTSLGSGVERRDRRGLKGSWSPKIGWVLSKDHSIPRTQIVARINLWVKFQGSFGAIFNFLGWGKLGILFHRGAFGEERHRFSTGGPNSPISLPNYPGLGNFLLTSGGWAKNGVY